ncbi:MAG: hypothetical protein AVDCRST_MAG77-5441 [uncultured Chloroflexi bacterium]|uniref:Uncharacterized protein n=1 Tax=uncultured Chloroflexota bacterium TaxID=166587 RepID=A0A6J4K915_9CHLR|nr:MAG: hypothetical protein AVDCRST_MAG77-5441 [uncultured Chloroflexota bacterium]
MGATAALAVCCSGALVTQPLWVAVEHPDWGDVEEEVAA